VTEKQIQHFYERIDKLTASQKPKFGKMNANQMICHCADFFRMATGTKKALEYGKVDPKEIISLGKSGKPTPAPKGFGQVEGDGTLPTNLENDKKILKEHIVVFSEFPDDYDYAPHPYFGQMDKKRWIGLAIYHLNHHLVQFNV